jgi:histidinol-phosphate phosphatase family protein
MTYKKIVGVDRDNTINHDEKAYFGSEDSWRNELRFCPGAVDGLRKLSENPNIAIAVLTAQVGIAKGVLTKERVEEVNATMDQLLKEQGVTVDSWQYCPFVDRNGAQRWEKKGITPNYNFVLGEKDGRLSLMKPQDGLLRRAAQELGIDYDSVQKYVVGDRSSDAMCGINSGGIGILINNPAVGRGSSSFDKTGKIEAMVEDLMYKGRVHIVSDLVEAARIVCDE